MRSLDSSSEQSEAQNHQQGAEEPVVRTGWNPAEQGHAEQGANGSSERCGNPEWDPGSYSISLGQKVDRDSCSVDQECRSRGRRHQLTRLELEAEQRRCPNSPLVPDETAEKAGDRATQESPDGRLGQRDAPVQEFSCAGDKKQTREHDRQHRTSQPRLEGGPSQASDGAGDPELPEGRPMHRRSEPEPPYSGGHCVRNGEDSHCGCSGHRNKEQRGE
jgi:hypothetical protein